MLFNEAFSQEKQTIKLREVEIGITNTYNILQIKMNLLTITSFMTEM